MWVQLWDRNVLGLLCICHLWGNKVHKAHGTAGPGLSTKYMSHTRDWHPSPGSRREGRPTCQPFYLFHLCPCPPRTPLLNLPSQTKPAQDSVAHPIAQRLARKCPSLTGKCRPIRLLWNPHCSVLQPHPMAKPFSNFPPGQSKALLLVRIQLHNFFFF